MMIEEGYKKRYKAGDTPWEIGKPDFNLIQTVTTMAIKPCKALDIGCGTGDNSIWLNLRRITYSFCRHKTSYCYC
ncbi:Tellurite resistance protein TehB [Desulfotomaculum arcticum]|uniref:Tellurite resistance protein TehB n=1 Tax=Desulfotruncus arcticus DSM 17038 TaxID=1121424 RepID=A0A1I2P6N1_9FIRM|nr:Tellurite resistance protein TehB [Desulfotomaculum arcticum] [Desulfotruncus arcticus DSM 17038]